MYCSKCGSDLPPNSIVCFRCAHPVSVVPTVKESRLPENVPLLKIAMVAACVAVAGAGIFYAIASASNQSGLGASQNVSSHVKEKYVTPAEPSQMPIKTSRQAAIEVSNSSPAVVDPTHVVIQRVPTDRQETNILFNGSIVAGASSQKWQGFFVPVDGVVSAHLEGSGGMRGEFELYIVDEAGLTSLRNGGFAQTFYKSPGRQATMSFTVPLKSGTYYLFVKNQSPWTSRTVTAYLAIN